MHSSMHGWWVEGVWGGHVVLELHTSCWAIVWRKIHTKIVTVAVGFRFIGWINLATSNFLWDEFRQVNEGRAMLACRLYDPFQDAEWIVQQARQTLCNHTLSKASLSISSASPVANCLTKQNDILMMRHQTRRCKAGTQWQIKPWKTRKSSHRRCNTFQLIFINDPHTSLSSMYSSHHRILFDRNHMFTCISPLPTNATREINDTSWILTITQSQSGNF